jgi:hypothetical protein
MNKMPEGPLRLHNPSRAEFNRCVAQHRPAILTGVMNGQPATQLWDLPYLRRKLGTQTVQVVQQERPRLFWDPQKKLPVRSLTFAAFAGAAFSAAASATGPRYSYLQDDINTLPGIASDYRLPSMMAEKGIVRGKFWLSGAGLITPLHYDPVETLHWVVRGSKRFVLFVPGVRRYYPHSWRTTAPFISQVDPDAPDPTRFPRFPSAAFIDLTVNAGEILYLPAFWWHQVYSLTPMNLSINFVWFASMTRYLRHLPQTARAGRHLLLQTLRTRALRSQRMARGGAAPLPVDDHRSATTDHEQGHDAEGSGICAPPVNSAARGSNAGIIV